MSTPPAIASLRLAPREEQDLRWFLQRDYVGDMGVRSPLGLQLEAAARVKRYDPWDHPQAVYVPNHHEPRRILDLSDDVFAAAARLRRLEARWVRLAPEHRDVLRAAYGTSETHLEGWASDLSPLVRRSDLARRLHARSRTDKPLDAWLERIARRKCVDAARLRIDAETRLLAACRAWDRTYGAARAA